MARRPKKLSLKKQNRRLQSSNDCLADDVARASKLSADLLRANTSLERERRSLVEELEAAKKSIGYAVGVHVSRSHTGREMEMLTSFDIGMVDRALNYERPGEMTTFVRSFIDHSRRMMEQAVITELRKLGRQL